MSQEALVNSVNLTDAHGSTLLLIRSYEEARMAFAVILSINLFVIMSGMIINATICCVMLRGKRYKRNSSNFFITHVSVVELVRRLLVFPFIVYFAVPATGIKTFQCKALSFFSKTSASAIIASLVVIAIDRHQKIVHPLKSLKSKRKPFSLVCLCWLYATIVSCPFVIGIDSISVLKVPEAQEMVCENCTEKKLCAIPQNVLGQSSTTIYFLLAFLVPLTIIFALYAKVAIFLHHRSKSGMMSHVAAKSRSNAVRMLIVTLFGYVLSLGPAAVFVMLRSFGTLNSISFDCLLLVSWMVDFATYTSSLANPLIYAYYNGAFRQEINRLFCERKGQKCYKG